MIEFNINGETYTEKEFQRDLKRYFDTLNEDLSPCKFYEDCKRCMFSKYELCGKSYVNSKPIKNSFEIIEKVYNWAQEHPVITNKDMLKKTFGKDVIHYIEARPYKEEWLDEEYKEPSKEQKGDKKNG